MTAVLETASSTAAPAERRRPPGWLAALPWLITAAALMAVLLWTQTPVAHVAAYAGYWVLGIVLPGTLTYRALRGSRGNLPEDLGFGAALGLLLELVFWALAAAVGAQSLLRWWPALVIVLFLAVPRLRRHWRIGVREPLPVAWSWLTALVVLLVIGWAAYTFRDLPLPPANTGYYQDLLYHLALVHEMTRSMPFQVPQVAGDTLRYHYLSDAHMAAASMITGVPASTVLLRLWVVPIAAVSVVLFAALGRDLTGKWWAGPLAAGTAIAGMPLTLGAPIGPFAGGAISVVSPSQTYAFPLAALLVALVVDVLRGKPLGWAWVVVPVLAVACAGAKSSTLPPLLVGVLLAGLLVWWRGPGVSVAGGSASGAAAIEASGVAATRPSGVGIGSAATKASGAGTGSGAAFGSTAKRISGGLPGFLRRRPVPWAVVGLLASIVGAMAVGFKVFAGGGAGTLALQPLSALTWMDPYQRTLGIHDGVAPKGLFLPGVETATLPAKFFIAGLVAWWLLMQAPRLLGLLLIFTSRRRTSNPERAGLPPARDSSKVTALSRQRGAAFRTWLTAADPAVWLLGGATLAGVGAAWAFWHPSASQLYFFAGVVPFGALLTVILLADLTRTWQPLAVGLAAGAIWVFVIPATPAPAVADLPGWTKALLLPVLWTTIALAVLLAAVVAVTLVRQQSTQRGTAQEAGSGVGAAKPGASSQLQRRIPRRALAVVAVAAVVGASLGTGVDRIVEALTRPADTTGVPGRSVTADEMEAALWLQRNAAADDVVATNVHCQPVRTTAVCDSRGFWVAGLGGHRTLIESWGYSDEAVQANGVGGRKYVYQPAPDPALFALNERVFAAPTAADLAALRTTHGVRWLFADTRAGPVAGGLSVLATPVFTSGPVTIYAL